MFSLFETDNIYLLKVLGELFYPAMEKTEDGILFINGLSAE
jgi:hypothetical protein